MWVSTTVPDVSTAKPDARRFNVSTLQLNNYLTNSPVRLLNYLTSEPEGLLNYLTSAPDGLFKVRT